jgi:hypothetical protein
MRVFSKRPAVLDHRIFGHDFAGPIDWKFNPTVETSRDNEWSWSLFRTIYWQPLVHSRMLSAAMSGMYQEFCEQLRSFMKHGGQGFHRVGRDG